jgi:hypothetical protein
MPLDEPRRCDQAVVAWQIGWIGWVVRFDDVGVSTFEVTSDA